MNQIVMKTLATPDEVAEYLRTTRGRLARHRSDGTGPRYVREGGRILYRWSDVEQWIDSRTRAQTSGEGA